MDNFVKFKLELQKHFDEMQKEATHLFEVNVDKDELWNTYLDSFPAGTNEIFRERREHDCSCCRQFIKNIGNAVVIKDNQIHTIWELNLGDTTYQPVCDALDAFVKSHTVVDIYTTSFSKIGTDHNFEEIDGKSHRWDHFFLELPRKFVNTSSKSNEEVKGQFRDTRNVFKRSLDEITMEALDTILELINSNTLYKGEEWKAALTEFKKYKKEFHKFAADGVHGEQTRLYRSVNSRNEEKIRKELIIRLLRDNPSVTRLNRTLASVAQQVENRDESKWLFDFDVDDESLMYDFVHDVIILSRIPLSDIQAYKTPHGYAIVVPHRFDTRELMEEWKDYDITLKRDELLFLDMVTKE